MTERPRLRLVLRSGSESAEPSIVSLQNTPLHLEAWGQYVHPARDERIQQAVNLAVQAAKRHQERVDLPLGVDPRIVSSILKREYPELYMLRNDYRYVFTEDYSSLLLNFAYDAAETARLQRLINVQVDEIVRHARMETDPVEQLRYVHDWFARNVAYSQENPHPLEDYTPVNVFQKHAAVCSGFTRSFQMICKRLGIDSGYIRGNASGEREINHAWNMVKLDGGIYHIDLTSAISFFERTGRVAYPCFMLTAEQMLRERVIEEPFECRDNSEGTYLASIANQFNNRVELEALLQRIDSDERVRTATIAAGPSYTKTSMSALFDEICAALAAKGGRAEISTSGMGVFVIIKKGKFNTGMKVRLLRTTNG